MRFVFFVFVFKKSGFHFDGGGASGHPNHEIGRIPSRAVG